MADADVIIIGSGIGGATMAASLAPSGRRILILERGERLVDCPEARDPAAIFGRGFFRPKEMWRDQDGAAFNPGNYAYVGGNSKFYGAVLLRYRAEDFRPLRHIDGTTPGWPLSYEDLEPYYQRAEALYQVRGALGHDPTEPPHSGTYPHPPIPDEPFVADLKQRLAAQGLHPGPLPLGVDLYRWLARGATTWDAFPDTCGGKMDAETAALAEALKHPNVTLLTGAKVTRLVADERRVNTVEIECNGATKRLSASTICLSAGAVMTAAILLSSVDEARPRGLANRSDQVGRNFMNHNLSGVIGINPFRRNTSVYEKTLQFNDWYLTGGPKGEPLGNVQMVGRITGPILAAEGGLPLRLAHWISEHSVHMMTMSEDLPVPESRVLVRNGQIELHWQRTNWHAHVLLVKRLKNALRRAGWPVVLSKTFEKRTPSHQCGTARMGRDPATSVVDAFGKAHDLDNLWIADASILPTSAAVNPSLTIAALSMRTAQRILETEIAI
jgi:choline dehydrogenase-like flavoprotein